MKILLAHDYGTRSGGAEVMMIDLRASLRARGHETRLFTSTARPLPLSIEADETCFGTTTPLRRFVQAVNPHAAYRLNQILRDFTPDVVLMMMFQTQLSPLVLPALRAIPAVLNIVNYNLVCPLNTKTLAGGMPCRDVAGVACHRNGCMPWLGVARATVQKRLTDLDVFDHVFAVSSWVAERLRAEGVRVDSWIHNGVATVPPRPPLKDPPTIGYAGRLIPKKGVDVLLRAFARTRERVPTARLVLVGDGPERSRLERQAGQLRIDESVRFVGHLDRPEMESVLSRTWVQAVPSTWEEPFGLVAAEAMMRGSGVVATSCGGLTEQVLEGRTGLLANPGDVDAFAAALVHVLSDRGWAETLGQRARRHALAEFTFEKYVDRLLDLLRLVVEKNVNRQAGETPE
jgi:glycosyltransferase involved in cell wall biosynthesis